MSDARSDILARIRGAVGPQPDRDGDHAAIPRAYAQTASLERAACLDLFAARLHDYEAGVYRAARAALPAAIARAAAARGKQRLLIPGGLPPEWLPPSIEFTPDHSLDYAALDASEGALTGCSVAVALTGSIFLGHSAGQGRRALTLVPDYHLCVVLEHQVVETVPEAMRRVKEAGCLLLTTISGPSATADIEMTRVKGVHGPRILDVILVGDS